MAINLVLAPTADKIKATWSGLTISNAYVRYIIGTYVEEHELYINRFEGTRIDYIYMPSLQKSAHTITLTVELYESGGPLRGGALLYSSTNSVDIPAWWNLPYWYWDKDISYSGIESTIEQRTFLYNHLTPDYSFVNVDGTPNFRATIWNDMVLLTKAVIDTLEGSWINTYATYENTRAAANDTLTASRFNSLTQNISPYLFWPWRDNENFYGYIGRLKVAGNSEFEEARKAQKVKHGKKIYTDTAHSTGWEIHPTDRSDPTEAIVVTGGPGFGEKYRQWAGRLWYGTINSVTGIFYVQLRYNTTTRKEYWVYYKNGWMTRDNAPNYVHEKTSTGVLMPNVAVNALNQFYLDYQGLYKPNKTPNYAYKYAPDAYSYYADGWWEIVESGVKRWYQFNALGWATGNGWGDLQYKIDTKYSSYEDNSFAYKLDKPKYSVAKKVLCNGGAWLARTYSTSYPYGLGVVDQRDTSHNSIWINIKTQFKDDDLNSCNTLLGWQYNRSGYLLGSGWHYLLKYMEDDKGKKLYPWTDPSTTTGSSVDYAWFLIHKPEDENSYRISETKSTKTKLLGEVEASEAIDIESRIDGGLLYDLDNKTVYITKVVRKLGDYTPVEKYTDTYIEGIQKGWNYGDGGWWYCTGYSKAKDEYTYYYGGWIKINTKMDSEDPKSWEYRWYLFDYDGYLDEFECGEYGLSVDDFFDATGGIGKLYGVYGGWKLIGSRYYLFDNNGYYDEEYLDTLIDGYPTQDGLSSEAKRFLIKYFKSDNQVDYQTMASLFNCSLDDCYYGISDSKFSTKANLKLVCYSLDDDGYTTEITTDEKGYGLTDEDFIKRYGILPSVNGTQVIIEENEQTFILTQPDIVYHSYFHLQNSTTCPVTDNINKMVRAVNDPASNLNIYANVYSTSILDISLVKSTPLQGVWNWLVGASSKISVGTSVPLIATLDANLRLIYTLIQAKSHPLNYNQSFRVEASKTDIELHDFFLYSYNNLTKWLQTTAIPSEMFDLQYANASFWVQWSGEFSRFASTIFYKNNLLSLISSNPELVLGFNIGPVLQSVAFEVSKANLIKLSLKEFNGSLNFIDIVDSNLEFHHEIASNLLVYLIESSNAEPINLNSELFNTQLSTGALIKAIIENNNECFTFFGDEELHYSNFIEIGRPHVLPDVLLNLSTNNISTLNFITETLNVYANALLQSINNFIINKIYSVNSILNLNQTSEAVVQNNIIQELNLLIQFNFLSTSELASISIAPIDKLIYNIDLLSSKELLSLAAFEINEYCYNFDLYSDNNLNMQTSISLYKNTIMEIESTNDLRFSIPKHFYLNDFIPYDIYTSIDLLKGIINYNTDFKTNYLFTTSIDHIKQVHHFISDSLAFYNLNLSLAMMRKIYNSILIKSNYNYNLEIWLQNRAKISSDNLFLYATNLDLSQFKFFNLYHLFQTQSIYTIVLKTIQHKTSDFKIYLQLNPILDDNLTNFEIYNLGFLLQFLLQYDLELVPKLLLHPSAQGQIKLIYSLTIQQINLRNLYNLNNIKLLYGFNTYISFITNYHLLGQWGSAFSTKLFIDVGTMYTISSIINNNYISGLLIQNPQINSMIVKYNLNSLSNNLILPYQITKYYLSNQIKGDHQGHLLSYTIIVYLSNSMEWFNSNIKFQGLTLKNSFYKLPLTYFQINKFHNLYIEYAQNIVIFKTNCNSRYWQITLTKFANIVSGKFINTRFVNSKFLRLQNMQIIKRSDNEYFINSILARFIGPSAFRYKDCKFNNTILTPILTLFNSKYTETQFDNFNGYGYYSYKIYYYKFILGLLGDAVNTYNNKPVSYSRSQEFSNHYIKGCSISYNVPLINSNIMDTILSSSWLYPQEITEMHWRIYQNYKITHKSKQLYLY